MVAPRRPLRVKLIALPSANLACRRCCAPRSGVKGSGASVALAKSAGLGSKAAATSGVLVVLGGDAVSDAVAEDSTVGLVGGDAKADSLAITFGGTAKSAAKATTAGTGPGAAKAQALAGSGPGGKAAASVRS